MAKLSEVLGGLKILERYADKKRRPVFVNGEHDIISVGDITEDEVSEADRAELDSFGWHFDEEVESWARFT